MANESDQLSEALVARPLPKLIEGLAMAVVEANKALQASPGVPGTATAINSAEIELKIALSLEKGSEAKIEAGGSIAGFALNASYARRFNFKEEAASTIKISMTVVPQLATAQ